MRRTPENPFRNPTLVGALTVLAVLLAVYLAYTANRGLPFLPTRELKVDIRSGADLVVGSDVDEGGARIGQLTGMQPVELKPSGQVVAQLTLTLSKSHGYVPLDSSVSIGERSLLGEKFVELTKGRSRLDFADGGTLPLTQTSVPVQIDDVLNTFTPNTRTAIQSNLAGFGNTFAGRGEALSETLQSLPTLLGHLTPVAANLASPETALTRFLDSTNAFTSTVAPLSQVNSQLFTDAADTLGAISSNPKDLEQTIAESPSTLAVSTRSLAVQRPFFSDLATLGTELNPATAELKAALPDINPALESGAYTLARTPVLDRNLQQTLQALRNLALDPGTNIALNGLVDTVDTLNPMMRYIGPYITVCNYWNYFWTELSDDVSEKTSFGTAQRVLVKIPDILQPNNPEFIGATAPMNGGGTDLGPLLGNEYLHNQPYGAAIDSQGNADCEVGQRGYPLKLNYFDAQGRNLVVDPHTPGDQGPTYTGVAHVPAGETYSRNPQTGPQLDPIPSNP